MHKIAYYLYIYIYRAYVYVCILGVHVRTKYMEVKFNI